MFFIPHGATREVENNSQQFDARTYQWRNVPKDLLDFKQYIFKEKEVKSEWLENNCHPNGVLFCPRCYRKHFIPDNFDFLCDGCTHVLKDYHSMGLQFEFTERFNTWYSNVPEGEVTTRIKLREALDKVFNSTSISFEGKEINITRHLLKNDGMLEVCFSDQDQSDKKNRFIINVKDIFINN